MAGEPWWTPYERQGRSGMTAWMSVTGGLSAEWWAGYHAARRARIAAGLESVDDCD